MMISTWHRMYVLPADLSYEPTYPDSLAGIAEAQGIDVREVLMDVMAGGRPILFLLGNYPGNLDGQVEAIEHPHVGVRPVRRRRPLRRAVRRQRARPTCSPT